jgi:hypothetical protein
VGRCLALWEELGAGAVFRVADEAVAGYLQARGAPVVRADGQSDAGAAPIALDRAAPIAVLDRAAPIALDRAAPIAVLDRAAPAAVAEVSALQAEGRRVALLDDLGPARMVADMVIDPPTAAAWPPAGGIRLSGFEHVLLRREVRAARSVHGARSGVLVAMGGSDPEGLTPLLAQGLNGAGIDVAVALGPGYRGASPTERGAFPTGGSTRVLRDAFVPALAGADLLVTGYGHTLLEAAHLGVPAIAAVYRPDQLEHARVFSAAGTAVALDLTVRSHVAELVGLVGRLLGEPGLLAGMSKRGQALVDGLGARRIARALGALT